MACAPKKKHTEFSSTSDSKLGPSNVTPLKPGMYSLMRRALIVCRIVTASTIYNYTWMRSRTFIVFARYMLKMSVRARVPT